MEKEKNTDFSHLDDAGTPRMVDVGGKHVTKRTAIAESSVFLGEEISALFNKDELYTKKGPVFQTAIIAGIMAAKKTHELIPMCHPLSLDHCTIKIRLEKNQAIITCEVKMEGKTGVEMEALTGASVAALTIYDMCKSISQLMVISNTKLLSKRGGKSDLDLRKDRI